MSGSSPVDGLHAARQESPLGLRAPSPASSRSLGVDSSANGSVSSLASSSSSNHNIGQNARNPRRKSSAPTAGSSSTTAGTFLSRFIGNFRSSGSPTSSLGVPRPPLPRSLSSPQQFAHDSPQHDTRSALPESELPGAFPPSSTTQGSKFRPSFTRRATTAGSPSPRVSPAHSPLLEQDLPGASPGSPATLRGRERDPMDYAIPNRAETDASARDRVARRGSTVSESTLRGEPSGIRTPNGERNANPLDPIAEPSTPQPLVHPIQIVTALLPPALQLLSQLGPLHLFSPPLVLPSLLESAGVSSAESAASMSDRASISSNTTSSSLHIIGTSSHIAHTYSHELHAPSTLSVPAVSAAAVWRLFRGFEWVGEMESGGSIIDAQRPPASAEDEIVAFDFPSALQGVADVLAAEAASKGVELVIGQVGSGSAPSPVTSPIDEASPGAEPDEAEDEKDTESRELLVRGDERAWSIVLVWILHHIISSATAGATVEVRFLATATDPPASESEAEADSSTSDDEEEAFEAPVQEKWWNVSLEILHTLGSSTSPGSPPTAPAPPPFDTPFAHALFSQLALQLENGPSDIDSRSWVLGSKVASPRPKALADDPASTLGRRRASLDPGHGHEPSMNDLKRFAETALKGQKVVLHSGELSTFAKHLTTYLAGWGMDVSHVPLDGETQSNYGGEKTIHQHVEHAPPHGGEQLSFKSMSDTSSASNATGDGSSNLIVIDDDVSTLRRILHHIRTTPISLAPTLMAKRPQLAARRTRSSPHVRQLHQLPAVNSSTVILHFASLSHYKHIKEIVQDALANSRSNALPEILVIPKPAGPRRIITALWTALRRPAVDPSLPPIATSPTTPGVQYWTPRLSPALAKEQDFDFSATAESSPNAGGGKARTPPAQHNPGVAPPAGHPPSPLGKISDDQVSYFACVADSLQGTTSSQGMVIQSPDGQAGLFFQPTTRNSRVDKTKGRNLVEQANSSSEYSRVPLATPHDIGLGQPRRASSSSITATLGPHDPSVPVGTPALTLDSFISAARSKAAGEEPVEDLTAPSGGGEALSRQISHTSGSSRPGSIRAVGTASSSKSTSPRVGSSTPGSRRVASGGGGGGSGVQSPPLASATNSPNLAAQANATRRDAPTQSPVVNATAAPSAPTNFARRRTMSSIKNKKKTTRRNTIATVPPINVLIVEDNPINQTILSMFMKKKGIKYAVAKDGEEAVQKWKAGSFHLVLMDIQLPVKSGIEATREIRAMERANNIGTFNTPSTEPTSPMSFSGPPSSASTSAPSSLFSSPISPPLSMPVIIVALTASSLQADRVSALAAGCNDFLTKPVSLPWLQQKLLEWGSMAYLSGFSSRSDTSASSGSNPMSEKGTPTSQSPAPHRPPRSASLYNVDLRSRADDISAHLHIDPRSHGRRSSPSTSPSRASNTSRGSSPGRSRDNTITPAPPLSPTAAAAAASIASPPSHPDNPSLTVSSPTPVDTPLTAQVPVSSAPIPPANTRGAPSDAVSATGVPASQPADLDAVDEALEHVAAIRPGPSPLSTSTSISDLSLEAVAAEGARLAHAGTSGSSFGQAFDDAGMSTPDSRQ